MRRLTILQKTSVSNIVQESITALRFAINNAEELLLTGSATLSSCRHAVVLAEHLHTQARRVIDDFELYLGLISEQERERYAEEVDGLKSRLKELGVILKDQSEQSFKSFA